MPKVPTYLSRLLQTLEPAFDQLVRIQVMGSYHVVSAEHWRIALHRHPAYVPERKTLSLGGSVATSEEARAWVQSQLEKAGIPSKSAVDYCAAFRSRRDVYQLQRAARLLDEMKQMDVLPHVAVATVRQALDAGPGSPDGLRALDWCEIALMVCRHKRDSGQALRNLPGLLIKIARDAEARSRLVNTDTAAHWTDRFRQREDHFLRQQEEAEERALILEYEQFRQHLAAAMFQEMAEAGRAALRRERAEALRNDQRFDKLPADLRELEVDQMIVQQLARREAPGYEKWLLRKRAYQAVLPFLPQTDAVQ
jgi:hypothetical protein